MAYATALELVIAFGARELAEVSTPKRFDVVGDERLELAIEGAIVTGEPDENALEACLDAINEALSIADSLVDSYLGMKYTLPLASTPTALKKRTLDLARFELHDERATEEVRNRRNDAIKWLEMLAAGKATLGDPAIDSGAANTAGVKVADTPAQKFTNKTDNAPFYGYGFD